MAVALVLEGLAQLAVEALRQGLVLRALLDRRLELHLSGGGSRFGLGASFGFDGEPSSEFGFRRRLRLEPAPRREGQHFDPQHVGQGMG